MSHELLGLHKEVYNIDGMNVTVICNFNSNEITIQWQRGTKKYFLQEYENFVGNMKDFAKEKLCLKS